MIDNNTVRALQYTRVSTVRQREEETIKSQEQAIERYVADHPGITITQRFSDDGLTGTTTDGRDGYKRMMDALASPDVQALIVYDLDRLNRKLENAIKLLVKCRELNKPIITVRDGRTYDPLNDMDAMLTIIATLTSAMESDKIHDRIMAGLARARTEGKRLGRPPVDVDWKEFDKYRAHGLSIASASRAMELKPRTVYKLLREREQA